MSKPWLILFVLFFARSTMAFQFQSIAALSPFIMDSLAITLADIGLLIGLYLGPGVVIALAGGAVATWLGDKRTVIAALALMVLGGLVVAQATSLAGAITGRLVAGIGGVVVNVMMTKLVIDWFAGRRLSTALAIFLSSWPLGIGLALLVLPALAGAADLAAAWTALSALTVVALVLFTLVYKAPPGATPASAKIVLAALPWRPLIAVALVWGLYNTAFVMIFGFGTLVFAERGLTIAEASFTSSLFILVGSLAMPLGGWLADRSGRGDLVILASLVVGIVLFPALLFVPLGSVAVVVILCAMVFGLCPGPIVALPGKVLPVEARAFGTGIFYSIHYLQMMIGPSLAGLLADQTGDVRVAFMMGSAMMMLAVPLFAVFLRSMTSRAAAPAGP